MKSLVNTLILVLAVSFTSYAQSTNWWHEYVAYFDGTDTSEFSLIPEFDTTNHSNVWMIGKPSKRKFNQASSAPGALMTDTLNPYPPNDSSRVWFNLPHVQYISRGYIAFQWSQQLHFRPGFDGGVVEFSLDDGLTWQNPHNNPLVANFFGFDTNNVAVLPNGKTGFTDEDFQWRNIWLCFEPDFIMGTEPKVRFTCYSDTVATAYEGWMIDNVMFHVTQVHTVTEVEQKEYLKVYPNPASGKVHIQAKQLDNFHIIEHLRVTDSQGRVVEDSKHLPTKYWVDLSGQPEGEYYFHIRTNKASDVVKVVHVNE
ncbi:T9SS type A sorting domain-containing protein [bacterium SCSIO 12741]|nr:T9SS type A sorting domain-containing protein [bacterium SCSIO 12741]